MFDLPPDLPPASDDPVIEQLVDCGLDRGGLSVLFNKGLQETVVIIADEAGASEETFECMHDALRTNFASVEFATPELWQAYWNFVSERERPERLAQARQSLAQLGMLEGLPQRSEFTDFSNYLRALERHAGVTEGAYLSASGEAIHFQPPLPKLGGNTSASYEALARLLTLLSYVSALEGVSFGFVGNERYAKD